MLQAMVRVLPDIRQPANTLRIVAVGGARVSARLIETARARGLPAFQGYGLSECASVVSCNVPGDDDPGTVGRPLPHVKLKIDDEGQVLIRSPAFLGYLGGPLCREHWWPSGDLGRLDPNGRLHVTGRTRDVFITAFGRNVSPEWIESELLAEPGIAQVAVFGEQRPFNVAVVVSGASGQQIDSAVRSANQRLPDYARIKAWVRASEPFTPDNGLATSSGSCKRAAIARHYHQILDSFYREVAHS